MLLLFPQQAVNTLHLPACLEDSIRTLMVHAVLSGVVLLHQYVSSATEGWYLALQVCSAV